jgi:hypothetical protein
MPTYTNIRAAPITEARRGAVFHDRCIVVLRNRRKVGTPEIRRDREGDERQRSSRVPEPPRARHHEGEPDDRRTERRTDGPRRVQRSHEADATSESGFGVRRRIEQAESSAEHSGCEDDRRPGLREGEQQESARSQRCRQEQERERAKTLPDDARQSARAELRQRHRREHEAKPGERCVELPAYRRPRDAEHPRRQPEDHEAAESDGRGPPAHRAKRNRVDDLLHLDWRESARHPVMSSVFKTADGALAFRGGFDSHALSPSLLSDAA